MNLMGFDPLHFFKTYRKHGKMSISYYMKTLPVAFELLIPTASKPDFIKRYPKLLNAPIPDGNLSGWEIKFTWYGLPISWTPVTRKLTSHKMKILHFDQNEIPTTSGRKMLSIKNGQATITNQLKQYLDLLFQD